MARHCSLVTVVTLFCALIALIYGTPPVRADIFAIDFGAESFKAAVVATGHVLEVATNEASGRATPSVVSYVFPSVQGVTDAERGVSSVAKRLGGRYPQCSFVRAKQILGSITGDAGAEEDLAQAPLVMVDGDDVSTGSGSLAYRACDGSLVSAEEVIAYVRPNVSGMLLLLLLLSTWH